MANQSRRKFLKLAGIAAVTLPAAACLKRKTQNPIPIDTADIDEIKLSEYVDLGAGYIKIKLHTETRKYTKEISVNVINSYGSINYRANENLVFGPFKKDVVVKKVTAIIDIEEIGEVETLCQIPETAVEKGATITLNWGGKNVVEASVI